MLHHRRQQNCYLHSSEWLSSLIRGPSPTVQDQCCVSFSCPCTKHSHPDSWVCVHTAWFTWHSQPYYLAHKSFQLFEVYGPDPQTSKHIPVWINTYCLNQSHCLSAFCSFTVMKVMNGFDFFVGCGGGGVCLWFFLLVFPLPLVEGLEAGVCWQKMFQFFATSTLDQPLSEFT